MGKWGAATPSNERVGVREMLKSAIKLIHLKEVL